MDMLTLLTGDEIFGHGWLREFFVFNKFGINCLIALMEVFAFSSIKRADVGFIRMHG